MSEGIHNFPGANDGGYDDAGTAEAAPESPKPVKKSTKLPLPYVAGAAVATLAFGTFMYLKVLAPQHGGMPPQAMQEVPPPAFQSAPPTGAPLVAGQEPMMPPAPTMAQPPGAMPPPAMAAAPVAMPPPGPAPEANPPGAPAAVQAGAPAGNGMTGPNIAEGIAKLQMEIASLRQQNDELQRVNDGLQRDNNRLRAESTLAMKAQAKAVSDAEGRQPRMRKVTRSEKMDSAGEKQVAVSEKPVKVAVTRKADAALDGYGFYAVRDSQAWIRTPDGSIAMVSVGDRIGNETVRHIDADNGVIQTTGGIIR